MAFTSASRYNLVKGHGSLKLTHPYFMIPACMVLNHLLDVIREFDFMVTHLLHFLMNTDTLHRI